MRCLALSASREKRGWPPALATTITAPPLSSLALSPSPRTLPFLPIRTSARRAQHNIIAFRTFRPLSARVVEGVGGRGSDPSACPVQESTSRLQQLRGQRTQCLQRHGHGNCKQNSRVKYVLRITFIPMMLIFSSSLPPNLGSESYSGKFREFGALGSP